MTDQPTLPDGAPATAPVKAATVTFSLPDVITVGLWDVYWTGRQTHLKANPTTTTAHADYNGALALIKAGLVHVKTDSDKVQGWLDTTDQSTVPAAFMGLVLREVSYKVEQALDAPLVI